MTFTAAMAAQWCHGRLEGPPDRIFTGMEALDRAGPDELTFVGHARYAKKLATSAAGGAVCTEGLAVERRADQAVIWAPDADLAVAEVLACTAPAPPHPPVGKHPTAVVSAEAKISPGVRIGPLVVIEAGAVIGADCVIMAQAFVGAHSVLGDRCVLWPQAVVRERCTLGRRVILHSGAVVGADGFGYRLHGGEFVKIPQIGTVEIGDDCELGANTTIDRGKFSATRLGRGCKLDNQVQIGHNVRIGDHAIVVAQAGVAGSVSAGKYLLMAGGSMVSDHVQLGDQVQIGATSALNSDAPSGSKWLGTPARPAKEFFVTMRALNRAASMPERITQLEERIARLESSAKNDRP